MFCVTFYSYKGGVGRTLALANVAVALAKRNKKVLLVDFDLEAPGLTTLKEFSEASSCPGIVDFVLNYIHSGKAPNALEYIHSCIIKNSSFENGAISIDIMPAGRVDDKYSLRYSRLDWGYLYDDKEGFLLMEDLRAQWGAMGYDYVLIDSRTGLTDIGGICTRQLPDAVVVVFFPNEQNLSGLTQVVPSIKNEEARDRKIELIYAASRVPRLDDENDVLKTMLSRFQDKLSYDPEDLITIEHYDSLSLINQSIFLIDRQNSGLSRQYGLLASSISQSNIEDADGVLRYLEGFKSNLGSYHAVDTYEEQFETIDKLSNIFKHHINDFVIQRRLANIYNRLGMMNESAICTDQALASIGRTNTNKDIPSDAIASIYHLRIRVFSELGDSEESVRSALEVLYDQNSKENMIIYAIMTIASRRKELLPSVDKVPAFNKLDAKSILSISTKVSASQSASKMAAEIARRAVYMVLPHSFEHKEITDAQLTLIAGGDFHTALIIGNKYYNEYAFDPHILFNTAMAEWGYTGKPNLASFLRLEYVINKDATTFREANHIQCHALVNAVIGNKFEALRLAELAKQIMMRGRRRDFSCWTYFTVRPDHFGIHCDAIVAYAEGIGPPPKVLSQQLKLEI